MVIFPAAEPAIIKGPGFMAEIFPYGSERSSKAVGPRDDACPTGQNDYRFYPPVIHPPHKPSASKSSVPRSGFT